MALANYVREQMSFATGDRQVADEVCDLIDTHASGTLSQRTKRCLRSTFVNAAEANQFITAVEASSALSAPNVAKLGVAMTSRRAADLVAAELIA